MADIGKIDMIENGLTCICDSLERSPTNLKSTREHIYAGEYALALDDLADVYLELGKPLSPDIQELFETLATAMDMAEGDGWDAVAKLRQSGQPVRHDRPQS